MKNDWSFASADIDACAWMLRFVSFLSGLKCHVKIMKIQYYFQLFCALTVAPLHNTSAEAKAMPYWLLIVLSVTNAVYGPVMQLIYSSYTCTQGWFLTPCISDPSLRLDIWT